MTIVLAAWPRQVTGHPSAEPGGAGACGGMGGRRADASYDAGPDVPAVPRCQVSSPKGQPRLAERRSASSSSSDCGSFTPYRAGISEAEFADTSANWRKIDHRGTFRNRSATAMSSPGITCSPLSAPCSSRTVAGFPGAW
jgi:hypothetical protein